MEGLINAAENVEIVAEPVINLSRKALTPLTGGVITDKSQWEKPLVSQRMVIHALRGISF